MKSSKLSRPYRGSLLSSVLITAGVLTVIVAALVSHNMFQLEVEQRHGLNAFTGDINKELLIYGTMQIRKVSDLAIFHPAIFRSKTASEVSLPANRYPLHSFASLDAFNDTDNALPVEAMEIYAGPVFWEKNDTNNSQKAEILLFAKTTFKRSDGSMFSSHGIQKCFVEDIPYSYFSLFHNGDAEFRSSESISWTKPVHVNGSLKFEGTGRQTFNEAVTCSKTKSGSAFLFNKTINENVPTLSTPGLQVSDYSPFDDFIFYGDSNFKKLEELEYWCDYFFGTHTLIEPLRPLDSGFFSLTECAQFLHRKITSALTSDTVTNLQDYLKNNLEDLSVNKEKITLIAKWIGLSKLSQDQILEKLKLVETQKLASKAKIYVETLPLANPPPHSYHLFNEHYPFSRRKSDLDASPSLENDNIAYLRYDHQAYPVTRLNYIGYIKTSAPNGNELQFCPIITKSGDKIKFINPNTTAITVSQRPTTYPFTAQTLSIPASGMKELSSNYSGLSYLTIPIGKTFPQVVPTTIYDYAVYSLNYSSSGHFFCDALSNGKYSDLSTTNLSISFNKAGNGFCFKNQTLPELIQYESSKWSEKSTVTCTNARITFWDEIRKKWISVVEIDLGELAKLDTSSKPLGIYVNVMDDHFFAPYRNTFKTSGQSTKLRWNFLSSEYGIPYGSEPKIIDIRFDYISRKSSKKEEFIELLTSPLIDNEKVTPSSSNFATGVRLMNSANLPNGGLFFVTNGTLYLQDNFNLNNQPALLAADSITILDPSLRDCKSRSAINPAIVGTRHVRAAIITGMIHPTFIDSTNARGLNNLFRALGKWSGSNIQLSISGSLLGLFYSKTAWEPRDPYVTGESINRCAYSFGTAPFTPPYEKIPPFRTFSSSVYRPVNKDIYEKLYEAFINPTTSIPTLWDDKAQYEAKLTAIAPDINNLGPTTLTVSQAITSSIL